MSKQLLFALMILAVGINAKEFYTPGKHINKTFESYGLDFLDNNCTNCHDDDKPDGDLNLLDLEAVNETNLAVWKSVWAQVALGEMPPKKKDKLTAMEKLEFSDWVRQEMEVAMKDKGGFHAPRLPKKGNFVNHDLLFSPPSDGLKIEPTATDKRIWRISPQEHITRLSILINAESKYDPQTPGLRTYGDAVPINHGGETKLYFGVDRITSNQGGTVAYATAVKSVPVVLSTMRKHGFANYAGMHSVNSAESTQILSKASDILKFMAYGPESLVATTAQITDIPNTYNKVRTPGDLRGLPSSLTYSTKVVRPLTPVYDLFKKPEQEVTEQDIRQTITYLFEMLSFRSPSLSEVDKYYKLVKATMTQLGHKEGLTMGLTAIFLDSNALFRSELANDSKSDKYGRVMLKDWELGLALNHSLSYVKPDETLREAIVEGKMKTRQDVKREATRMLEDDSFRKPRMLQFFREYFDYDLAGYICKDEKALKEAGIRGEHGKDYSNHIFYTAASTDRLVELILQEDKNVLKELLTTDKVVVNPNENIFYGQFLSKIENKRMEEEAQSKISKPEKLRIEQEYQAKLAKIDNEMAMLKAQGKDAGGKKKDPASKPFNKLKKQRSSLVKAYKATIVPEVLIPKLTGKKIHSRVGRRSFKGRFNDPNRQLTSAPKGQRMGILTHPSWLVSHTDAMDNHAIHRGIWIRERLLGGGIPDVPITVDAQLPDEPGTTLRSRMRVTQEKYCWSCHEKMDPLGLTFENFNHVGMFRKYEHNKPVNTAGAIIDSGDPNLDGPVADAYELIEKLANSERVEQVFVRHAFRFWIGRNETLHDGPVLRDAHKAYKESGGSMKALLASLLTSDAFLYRK